MVTVTNVQLGNLFGSWKTTCTTLIVGSFQSGPIVALILKLMYESGWSSNSIFRLLNYLSVLVWARTVLLMPYTHVPQDTDCEYICLLEKLYRKVCSKKSDTSSEIPAESNELYTSEKLLSITSEKEKNEINDNSQIESETTNTSPTFIDILKTKLFWFEVFFFVGSSSCVMLALSVISGDTKRTIFNILM